jgi:hypothetical protein
MTRRFSVTALKSTGDVLAYGDEEWGRVSAIPIVMCPHCGTRMTLSRIAPTAGRPQGRMHYACSCGFGYPTDIGFSHRL